MKKLVIPILALLVAISVLVVSCTTDDDVQNLLEIAQSTPGLDSLVNVILAVEAAGEFDDFTSALADESLVLTVFAPNNDAFVALFELIESLDEDEYTVDEDGDGIINDTDITNFINSIIAIGLAEDAAEVVDFLVDVLGLHIIAGEKLLAADVVAAADDSGSIGPTLAEVDLLVEVEESVVTITPDDEGSTGADIVDTDVEGSNGVAHVINAVLLPPLPL
jgi:uncharacterized surface protein with fasciclin (FAS1) repeats